MKHLKTLLFSLFLIAFVASCSDDKKKDPVNPDPTTNFFPMTVNSYWVYDTWDLDLNNVREDDTHTVDSMAIVGTESIMEKNAAIQNRYSEHGNRTTHFYSEDGKLFCTNDYLMPSSMPLGIDIVMPNAWYKIVDENATSQWTVWETEIVNEPIDFGGLNITLNLNYKIKAETKSAVNFVHNGVSRQAIESVISFEISGTGTPSGIPMAIPINFTLVMRDFYADNIGLYRHIFESKSVTINQFVPTMDLYGSEWMLKSVHIAN